MKIKKSTIQKIIRKELLFESKSEKTKEIQRIIGTNDDGDWGPETDKKWFAWCKEKDTINKAWGLFSSKAQNVKAPDENAVKNAVKSGNIKNIEKIFKKIFPSDSGLSLIHKFVIETKKSKARVDMSAYPSAIVRDVQSSTAKTTKKIDNSDQDIKKQATVEKGSGKILYMGDSQMAGGNLGRVLVNKFGNKQAKVAEGGKQAIHFVGKASKGDMTGNSTEELKKKPDAIIISLNGNGIQGTEKFLEKIKKLSPGSKMVWLGAPPITKQWKEKDGKIIPFPKKYSWSKYTQNPKSFNRVQKIRKDRNEKVKKIIQKFITENPRLSWSFIDPYDYLDDKTVNIKGYDGVHLTKERAQYYVNSASDEIQKAIGGGGLVTETKNIRITQSQLRKLLQEIINL